MKQFIKDYFSFNRIERNGILVLLGIIIILILYLSLSDYFVTTQKVDFSGFEKEVDEFMAAQQAHSLTSSQSFGYDQEERKPPSVSLQAKRKKLFLFDPNNISEEEWRQLGLKDWQIKAIQKYKEKAGDFYTKEDFKKLRVINDEQYQLLEPYILLPGRGWVYKIQIKTSTTKIPIKPENFNGLEDVSEYMENGIYKYTTGNEKEFEPAVEIREKVRAKGFKSAFVIKFRDGKRIFQRQPTGSTLKNRSWRLPYSSSYDAGSRYVKAKIEINSADIFELKKLDSIGPVRAKRIIQYRNLLGGFFKKEQLLEVYSINAPVYESISEFIEVDGSKIKKRNINTCPIYQLNLHPYITWNVASAIVNYRDRHGKYANVSGIRKTDLVDDALFRKIAPYLTIE